jgi:hypothetical protein
MNKMNDSMITYFEISSESTGKYRFVPKNTIENAKVIREKKIKERAKQQKVSYDTWRCDGIQNEEGVDIATEHYEHFHGDTEVVKTEEMCLDEPAENEDVNLAKGADEPDESDYSSVEENYYNDTCDYYNNETWRVNIPDHERGETWSELSLGSIEEQYKLNPEEERRYQEFCRLQAEERLAEEEEDRQIHKERMWEAYVDDLVAQGYHYEDAKKIMDCYYSIQDEEDLSENKWLNAHGIYVASNKYYNN